ncbi:MAG: hypothetical protein HZC54_20560 [Verrucomicrobia bacterium]|nr:hypothetical protein [Verrucomicrobiota bacterium]
MKWNTISRSVAALVICWFAAGCNEKATLRVFLQASDRLPEGHRKVVVIRNPPMNVTVNPLSELSEHDLVSAKAVKTPTSKQLVLQFDPHGQRAIETFTAEHRGALYVMTINAVPVAAPLIREVIRDGRLVVDVDVTDEELDKIVKGLSFAAKDAHMLDRIP